MKYQKTLLTILLITLIAPLAGAQTQDSTRYKSGYDDIPEFGGPDGPARSVKDGDEDKKSVYTFSVLQRALAPYFDFKKRANDNHGVSFGFQYYLLPQNVYNYDRYPQKKSTRIGDYILVLGDIKGLDFALESSTLRWNNETLSVKLIDSRRQGTLYKVVAPNI